MSLSKWRVITGTFSSGKTTIIKALTDMGHQTVAETARALIEEEMATGKTIQQIRGDEASFEARVLQRKLQIETSLSVYQPLFLDRAMPDSIAYHRLIGLDPTPAIKACQKGLYQKVFCLAPLTFAADGVRTESDTAMATLHEYPVDAYMQLDYGVVIVPPLPPQERLQFILNHQ